MRVVIDTNVIVSRILSPAGTPAKIFAAWEQGRFELLVSPAILNEYHRVLAEAKIRARHRMSDDGILDVMKGFEQFAVVVEPEDELGAVDQDPDDNQFVDCAVAGNAAYIVSGDAHLLAIGEVRGIPIVRPSVFLALLSSATERAAE